MQQGIPNARHVTSATRSQRAVDVLAVSEQLSTVLQMRYQRCLDNRNGEARDQS